MGNGERRNLEEQGFDAQAGEEQGQDEQDMVHATGQDVLESDVDIEAERGKARPVKVNLVWL